MKFDLSPGTIEVLRYIRYNHGCIRSDICNDFDDSIDTRLDELFKLGFIDYLMPNDSTSLIIVTGSGKTFLRDLSDVEQLERKDFLRKLVIVPAVITILANVMLFLLQWSFPPILKLLSGFLNKIFLFP